MVRRVPSRLSVVMAMSVALAGAPPKAHAIPNDGSYVCTAGSGLTGHFTISGTDMTVYEFTDDISGTAFTNVDALDTYFPFPDSTQVQTQVQQGLATIMMNWKTASYDDSDPLDIRGHSGAVTFTAAVPESPSATLLFAGLGLLGLMAYVRRQRR